MTTPGRTAKTSSRHRTAGSSRPRRRVVVLGVATALALTGCTARNGHGRPPAQASGDPAPTHPTAETTALERAVFERVNHHRKTRGLAALTLDARISRQARLHSAAMAAGEKPLGHEGFEDRVKVLSRMMPCLRTAENVAFNRGHRDPAAEAVRGWLASRAHRENIEGPYDLTGVGVVRNAAGEVYLTQIFVGR